MNNKRPLFHYKNYGEQEYPFIWKGNTGWNVIFKDQVASFTGERGERALSHSTAGVHWELDKAWSKAMDWSDGTK